MAGNAKIIYGDTTLIDLTQDTATVDKVAEGYTFHDKSGELRTGTMPAGGGGLEVDSLVITTPATKRTFNVGESFSVTGLVVTATIGSLVGNVVADCTFSPSVGTVFTEEDLGYTNVTISYGGETITYQIRIKQGVDIVPWATGTDAQIADMLEAHYAGDIDIYTCEGWEIGAERVVSLGNTGLLYPRSTGTLVLMDKNGKELVNPINGHTTSAYVVGFKEILGVKTIKESSSGVDYLSWDDSELATQLNTTILNALPQGTQNLLKSFKVPYTKLLDSSGTNELRTMNSYLSIPSYYEVFGTIWISYGNTLNPNIEGEQFEYYEEQANRIKYRKDEVESWWLRTVSVSNPSYYKYFAIVTSGGGPSSDPYTLGKGVSPFGVI